MGARTLKIQLMSIEIRNPALEERIQKQLEATGSNSIEEVLLRLLETKEEQDRWLRENREGIDAKIRHGIEQLDRGEGIPDYELRARLAKLKSRPK
ncbi:MAG TPA: hypothetical protein VII81_11170 [Terriglobales bacterium]|jgi:hypothetical protein